MKLEIIIDAEQMERYEIEFDHEIKNLGRMRGRTSFEVEHPGVYPLVVRQVVHKQGRLLEAISDQIELISVDRDLYSMEFLAYRTEIYIELDIIGDTQIQISGTLEELNQQHTLKRQVFKIEENPAIKDVQITYIKVTKELEKRYKRQQFCLWCFGGLVEVLLLISTIGSLLDKNVASFIGMLMLLMITTGIFGIASYMLKMWFVDMKNSIERLKD